MSNFNRSFVNAIPLGMKASNDWQANERADAQLKMQQAAEARTQTKFDQEQDTYNKLQVLQKQLTNPNADNYSLGNSATEFAPSPVSVPMSISDSVPDVPQLGLTTGVKLGGEGMKAQSGGEGMQPKQQLGLAPAKKLTANKTPERGAASNILAEMAILKGDTEGFARHKQTAADFDYEDGFNGKVKEFTSVSPEQRAGMTAPLVEYLNTNNKSITMHEPDKSGIRQISIVNADGKASLTRLTLQDQAKLYAAHMMMETNPTKAMAVMQSVNKDLAAAIAADNGIYGDAVKLNNDAAAKAANAKNDATRTGLYAQSIRNSENRQSRLDAQSASREQDQANMQRLAGQYNQLATQLRGTTDPSKRKAVEDMMYGINAQMHTLAGKTVQLGRPEPEFRELPAAGGLFEETRTGRTLMSTEKGGHYDVNAGLDPTDMKTLIGGLPSGLQGLVTPSKYGDMLDFNGKSYHVKNPDAMRKLKADYEQSVIADSRLEDAINADRVAQERAKENPNTFLNTLIPPSLRGPNAVVPRPRPTQSSTPLGLTKPDEQNSVLSALFNRQEPRTNTGGFIR